jgi:hypothetical protein
MQVSLLLNFTRHRKLHDTVCFLFHFLLILLIDYDIGLGIGSLCVSLGLCFITYTILCLYIIRENKKREPARLAAMPTAPDNIEFLDLTDKENPLFVYVY